MKGANGKSLGQNERMSITAVRIARAIVNVHPSLVGVMCARELENVPKPERLATSLAGAQWVHWLYENAPDEGTFVAFVNATVDRVTEENGGAL